MDEWYVYGWGVIGVYSAPSPLPHHHPSTPLIHPHHHPSTPLIRSLRPHQRAVDLRLPEYGVAQRQHQWWVYVCLYIYVYVCMSVCVCSGTTSAPVVGLCVSMCVFVYVYACMSVYMEWHPVSTSGRWLICYMCSGCLFVCVCVYLYVCLCLSMCICVSLCVLLCIYLCIYLAIQLTPLTLLTCPSFQYTNTPIRAPPSLTTLSR